MSIQDDLSTRDVKIAIRQIGQDVALVFRCPDQYAAILLAEKIAHAIRGGGVAIGGSFEVDHVEIEA